MLFNLRILAGLILILPFAARASSDPAHRPEADPAPSEVVVMSFNVRNPDPRDGPDIWDNRRNAFLAAFRAADADFVGTQELFQHQGDFITAELNSYRWFGADRFGGHTDEHMGLFYRRDRWNLIDHGQFWLSDTPEVPGSMTWSHLFPRMVTWGEFTRVQDAGPPLNLFVFNTHFPHRAQDEDARTRAAALLRDRINRIAGDAHVVVTGDFNTSADSKAHEILTQGLSDSWSAVPHNGDAVPGHHGFKGGQAPKRIDWILTRGFATTESRTDRQQYDGRYPSDHYPVISRLTPAR